jgi:hypothetical protein
LASATLKSFPGKLRPANSERFVTSAPAIDKSVGTMSICPLRARHFAPSHPGGLHQLLRVERPKVVETVAWAPGNGDRSENGDYIYGKRRLREIDRRIRFLSMRLASAEVVDPKQHQVETVPTGEERFKSTLLRCSVFAPGTAHPARVRTWLSSIAGR